MLKSVKIGEFLKNSLRAILQGEYLMRLHIDRYLLHIIYAFFLLTGIIWVSLMIETTMSRVEQNKAEISELQITLAQKTYELVKTSSRNSVSELLEGMDSDVKEATKPATMLKKR